MAGLKRERDLRDALGRRLGRTFAEDIAGAQSSWPYALSLGRPTKKEILSDFDAIVSLTKTLRSWEQQGLAHVGYATREAGGAQRIPARVEIPTMTAAAKLATPRGREAWTAIVRRTERRATLLAASFGELEPAARARVLRSQDGCDDLAFDLLLAAGAWFRTHDTRGLTPREVPLPGIDGKWLDNARRRALVCLLAGKEDLGLVGTPNSLAFAYLDPAHLASGGRRYDSWVQGDAIALAYVPSCVIIVENKDTYLMFPQVEEGICVFGSGKSGAALVSQLPWILAARRVVYWGDLDADGFEILDGYRAKGIRCQSILMDLGTLERLGRYGTNLEKDHKTPIARPHKELANLTDDERAAYELITSPDYVGNRRLEQEKIPLAEALAALELPFDIPETT